MTCQLSYNLLVLQFGDGKVGIISRNEIGLLMWDTDEVTTEKINLGSRLKATYGHITGLGCASHPHTALFKCASISRTGSVTQSHALTNTELLHYLQLQTADSRHSRQQTADSRH